MEQPNSKQYNVKTEITPLPLKSELPDKGGMIIAFKTKKDFLLAKTNSCLIEFQNNEEIKRYEMENSKKYFII